MKKTTKVLVTGGAGFIGSNLVDRLIEKGYKVVVIDNLSTGRKENLNPKAKFYKIDICSPKIRDIFYKERPKIVFHYAAQINVRKSIEDPIEDANINILGTLNILENCKNFKVKKFIFPSSVGVYGEPQHLPISEAHPLQPIAPYPVAKLTVEKYLNYYQTQGFNFTVLRYSNVYGPRQLSSGEAGVIAIFIRCFLNGKRPIIFGNGKQTRDFLYVEDAVSAAVKSIKAPSGTIYNVGTGEETSVNDTLELFSQIFDKKINPVFQSLRKGEIIKSSVNFQRIKKEFSWRPMYDFKKGIRKTVEWFRNYEY